MIAVYYDIRWMMFWFLLNFYGDHFGHKYIVLWIVRLLLENEADGSNNTPLITASVCSKCWTALVVASKRGRQHIVIAVHIGVL